MSPARSMLLTMLAVLPLLAGGNGTEDGREWARHSHAIHLDGNKVSGPGAEKIVAWASQSQFVYFGEQHGVAGLPDVIAATWARLHPAVFHYLALEMGPWFAGRLSRAGVERSLAAFPYSLAFDYDGQARLLRTVEARFDAPGDAFWGLDQEIVPIHPFARLAEILPSHSARAAARGCI